jgi:hypothetical protein
VPYLSKTVAAGNICSIRRVALTFTIDMIIIADVALVLGGFVR